MRSARWLCVLGLLVGCDGDTPPDPCAQSLSALRARLEQSAMHAEPPGAPDWVELLSTDRGAPLEGVGPLLVITPDDVELAGRGVGGADDAEAAEALAQDLRAWARAARLEEEAELRVAIWSSADTRMDRLEGVLRLCPERTRFALLVRGPPVSSDAPEWITEAFAPDSVGRPRVRRQRIERAWRRATHACTPARPHLVTGGGLDVTGPALGPPSIDRLMEALAECGCDDTGLEAIESVASRALVPPEGPVLRLAPSLRFGPSTDSSVELAFAPDDTVETLRDRLLRERGTVWVRVD